MYNLVELLNSNKKINVSIFDVYDRITEFYIVNQPSELIGYAGQHVQFYRELDGDDFFTVHSLVESKLANECSIMMSSESHLICLLLLIAAYNCGKPYNERVHVDIGGYMTDCKTGEYMVDYNPVNILMAWIMKDKEDLNMIQDAIPNVYLQTE